MNTNVHNRIAAGDHAALKSAVSEVLLNCVPTPRATFHVECRTPRAECRDEYNALMDRVRLARRELDAGLRFRFPFLGPKLKQAAEREKDELFAKAMLLTEEKWVEDVDNLVTTGGKNDLLDKYFAGSSYTAAWFCGLVSSVSFTAYAAGDTMASHAGWTEAGPTNAPNYDEATRPALTFAAAAAGSKATSTPSAFTFNAAGTIKGMFATSVSTKDGTTGILYNAVNFTGGDRVVADNDVVNVSVTFTAT